MEENDSRRKAEQMMAGVDDTVSRVIESQDQGEIMRLRELLWERGLPERGALMLAQEILDQHERGAFELELAAFDWIRVRCNSLAVLVDLCERSVARLDEFCESAS